MFASRMLSRCFLTRSTNHKQRIPQFRLRPCISVLEDRSVPAALVVTSNLDDGSVGTLRAVMLTADTNGEADTISFQAGVTAITLATGQISMTTDVNNLTINGAGVTVSGAAGASATNRIFNFNVAGGNPTFTISGLTLASGNLSTGNGGAILVNNDPLTLTGVTFNNNKTAGAGGAISLGAATTLTMTSSTFTSNTATGVGGAVNAATGVSTITVDSCTFTSNQGSTGGVFNNAVANTVFSLKSSLFSNNKSTGAGGALYTASSSTWQVDQCQFVGNSALSGGGGAVRMTSNAVTFNVNDSTFSGNTCTTTGGAVYFAGATAGNFPINNSTFSNNSAGTSGGALHIGGSATYTINNSTFSGNTAKGNSTTTGGGALNFTSTAVLNLNNSTVVNNAATGVSTGGGIRRATATGTTNIISTIVALNTAGAGPDMNFSAAVTVNGGANLIGVADVGNFTLSTTAGTNQTGSLASALDPLIGPLQDNGGVLLPHTFTHKLLAGSLAFNNGNQNGLPLDQAGNPRPLTGADIGALEGFTVIPSAKATAPAVPPILGTVTVTVEYSDETAINTAGIDTDDVRLSGPGYPVAVAPTSAVASGSGMKVTATYVFPTPSGGWDWFYNGKYTVTMQANQVFDTDGPNAVLAGPIGNFSVTVPLPPLLVDNNATDTDDGLYGPGQMTLREAIGLANGTTGTMESISFAGSLTGQTISLGSALSITDPVQITGLGAANLTVSGGGTSRIFDINTPSVGGDVSVSGLTLSNGNATSGVGGAIALTDENLTLTGVNLTSNAITGAGGAIGASGAATITVGNSTISNNTASTTGGGIHLAGVGAITITNSTLNANVATTTGGAIHTASTVTLNITDSTISNNQGTTGGGVRVINAGSTTSVIRSTVSGNIGSGAGGGFYVTGGTMTVEYSTFSGNTAGTSGGGIGMTSTTITLTNSTISGNIANGTGTTGGGGLSGTTAVMTINNSTITGNAAPLGVGGGIRKTSATGTVTLQSTIVGANTAGTGGQDIHGTVAIVVAGDNNLVQDDVNGAFTLSGVGNITGLDPLVSALGNNGGPTQTHSLQPGSPAFNAGNNLLNLNFDQRGSGNPRVLTGFPDIGSYEGVSVIPSAKATAPNVPPALADVTVTVIYSDETGINTGGIDVNDVKLSGPGYPVAVAPTSAGFMGSGKSVTATYVFPTPIGGWDALQNGKYVVNMQSGQVFDTDGPNAVNAGPIGSFNVAIPLPPLVVDKIGDDVDGNYGAGQFTLREALGLTNGSASPLNSISFAPSLFAGGAQTITLTGGQMVISKDVAITGPGADKLIIDANNASRVFNINNGVAAKMDVSISGMTLAKGQTTGGISTVADGGGAIFIESENVTLDGMELRDNVSASFGGAIMSNSGSSLLITNSSLHHNKCNGGDSTQGGGAIQLMFLSSGNMTIRNSTLAFNQAGVNTTNSVGGAIIGYSGVPALVVENCTITQNTAHQAGGIRSFSSTTGAVLVRSSIISGNIGTTSQPDLQTGASTPWTISDSLIGSTIGFGGSVTMDSFTSTNIGYAVQLGPVQNNGGRTSTMELLKTNTVGIDQGSNPSSLPYDQRGVGFARSSGSGVDIGAFEIQAATPPQVTGILINNGAAQRSLVTSMKVSFSEAVTLGAGAFVLQRYANGAAGTIGLAVNQVGGDVTLTFTNTGSISLDPGSSLPDGTYELTIVANNVTGTLGGGTLDGNKNGTAQGSPADDVSSKLHRLFGDSDGNGSITASDFNAFRLAYGAVGPSIFDFDNSNSVTAADFNSFRLRYGLTGYQP